MDIPLTEEPPRAFDAGMLEWWRFSRYELHAGCIRPAPGAPLVRYDVWDAYRKARSSGGGERPYDGLFPLFAARQTEPDVQAVLRWCSRHGLLGELLHRCEQVVLSPRLATYTAPPHGQTRRGRPFPAVCWSRYVWTNTGWQEQRTYRLLVEKYPMLGPVGELAPRELWPADPGLGTTGHRHGSGVWLRAGLTDPGLRIERLDQTWRRFFRTIPVRDVPTYAYPEPGTTAFCNLYTEPLDVFQDAARTFVEVLGQLKGEPPTAALYGLADLVRGTQPALLWNRRDQRAQQAWFSRSLLGAYAMMALLDVAEEGRRFIRCDVCHRLFGTNNPLQRHCGPNCRWTGHKRKQRGSRREYVLKPDRRGPRGA